MPPGIALFHTGLGGNAGLRVTDRVPYALSYVHTDILNAMQSKGPRRRGLEESERPGCVLFWQVFGRLTVCWSSVRPNLSQSQTVPGSAAWEKAVW